MNIIGGLILLAFAVTVFAPLICPDYEYWFGNSEFK